MLEVRRIAIAALTAVALSACASHDTVKNADADAGHSRAFNAPFDTVRAATLEALSGLQLTPSKIEDVPEGTAIYIARPVRLTSWGEVGRVLVVKSDTLSTTVRALYERRMGAAMGAESTFARNLFARMDVILANAGYRAAP